MQLRHRIHLLLSVQMLAWAGLALTGRAVAQPADVADPEPQTAQPAASGLAPVDPAAAAEAAPESPPSSAPTAPPPQAAANAPPPRPFPVGEDPRAEPARHHGHDRHGHAGHGDPDHRCHHGHRGPRCHHGHRRRDRGEGMGQFLVGAAAFDLSSLNDRLAAAGYDEVEGMMTVIGGEGHGVLEGGAVFGGRGAAILGPGGEAPGDMRTRYGGGFGMFEAGYAPVHSEHLLLMFLGGFGGYGVGLDVSEEREARFDDVLADPRRGTSLSQGGILVGLTFGLDGRVPIGEIEDGQQPFFTFGLRLSGLYGPAMGDWELDDGSRLTGAPDTGLAGVYAAAVIGFGGGPAPGYPEFRHD